ncbi:aminotransferase-like mobile domain-containing protein [Tanacetum coccineum]|uniref:Aminotransferase-like mobile domain-containing protein n=1 Tax=Tanacetum coccineum TaxID=301880 RepID=A0ABQ5H4N3_9ASTR
MKTSLSLQSEPGIYTEWSSTDTHKRHYLTIPSDFEGYSGLLSLSVCIRKCISSEFEVEAEETEEVFGNEDNGNANGALQVLLADPGVLDCSICHEPLCTPVFQCQNGHLACCLCCSKVETICPICYPLGYKFTRCRGLEVAIESIGRILCINETLAAAYSNKKSEHEQMLPPHSFQEDDDELIPIQDVEPDLLMSEEEEDEDKLELMGKNQQQHTTNNENEALQVVLDDPNILDCMICSNLLFPPVFQCETGHLACSRCCSEFKGVCLCCMPNNNRCRGFEKFIESISSISCKNARSGCKKTVSYNNKSKHEQSCPHATCWCPYPSCSFAGSFQSLYFHFDIKHTASTARFIYGTTFSICIEIDQTTIFLQEQNENVIFILNHEVQEHERALNIDCVGVGCFKSGFVYQLTAKSMETCLSLRSVPEIYTEWSKDTPRKCNLTVPSGFADYDGLLSLSVCIKKKVIPSEFEEEMKEVSIEFDHNLDGRPKARLPVPSGFADYNGLLSLFVYIKKKVIPSEFEEEMKEARLPAALCNSLTRSHWFIKGLENIFKSVIVPCKNNGCNMAMLLRYQNEHEQVCPHATCFCPYPSCPFTGSHENLYLHFGLKHEADITVSPSPHPLRPTLFLLCWAINQEYLFLQEEQASVIFILNHQVQLHERTLKCECVPQIFAKWSKHNMPLHEDYYLAVPSEFAGYNGLLSLSSGLREDPPTKTKPYLWLAIVENQQTKPKKEEFDMISILYPSL